MIKQSIIPRGFSPSYECWKWLYSEHQRLAQIGHEARCNGSYRKACNYFLFADMLINARSECAEAQSRAFNKHLAKIDAELATMPDYSGMPF